MYLLDTLVMDEKSSGLDLPLSPGPVPKEPSPAAPQPLPTQPRISGELDATMPEC